MFPQLSLPYGDYDSVDALVRAASAVPIPGEDEERRLARAAREGDDTAKELLLRAHIRVVVDEAIRYRDQWTRTSELLPKGLEALEAAVARFDPEVHGRLDDWVREWVRMEIRGEPSPA